MRSVRNEWSERLAAIGLAQPEIAAVIVGSGLASGIVEPASGRVLDDQDLARVPVVVSRAVTSSSGAHGIPRLKHIVHCEPNEPASWFALTSSQPSLPSLSIAESIPPSAFSIESVH